MKRCLSAARAFLVLKHLAVYFTLDKSLYKAYTKLRLTFLVLINKDITVGNLIVKGDIKHFNVYYSFPCYRSAFSEKLYKVQTA